MYIRDYDVNERKIKIKPVGWVQAPVLYKHRCRHFCTGAKIFAPVQKNPHRCKKFRTGAKNSAPVQKIPHRFKNVCFKYETFIWSYAPVPVRAPAPVSVHKLSNYYLFFIQKDLFCNIPPDRPVYILILQ